ncbi:hypothetical protein CDL12_04261 [Handroanthus impetiginosus]|uniref:Wall-associated receptor kinase galacturonan-binding domain-containing protein n=1 Tax=Handroanthus impetiginosus TaxID=429701 RepID=A0A2G9HZS7_9LAMI|nr:hypothetical protein CDL12_04261 [Handroanthus impetiginosus]
MGFLQIQFINLLTILVIIASSESSLSATPPNFPIAKPSCISRCGNLSIPYPFGTTPDCYENPTFFITCNHTFDPPQASMQNLSIEIIDISLDGQLQFIAGACYSRNGTRVFYSGPKETGFTLSLDHLPILVVDWAIGNGTCEEAQMNASSYACKSVNSRCYKPDNGYGYRCSCFEGYQGNPYLINGCQGMD